MAVMEQGLASGCPHALGNLHASKGEMQTLSLKKNMTRACPTNQKDNADAQQNQGRDLIRTTTTTPTQAKQSCARAAALHKDHPKNGNDVTTGKKPGRLNEGAKRANAGRLNRRKHHRKTKARARRKDQTQEIKWKDKHR
tara:strand:+ start:880 stop:1299 length:420 start_codon:yes stop_codon:yes gene_type:complete